jgi:hypothetical protein
MSIALHENGPVMDATEAGHHKDRVLAARKAGDPKFDQMLKQMDDDWAAWGTSRAIRAAAHAAVIKKCVELGNTKDVCEAHLPMIVAQGLRVIDQMLAEQQQQ